MLNASRSPITAERPLLSARGTFHDNDAIRAYPNRPVDPDKWTIAGPNCPNEVWIHKASPYSDETGYKVCHRHSGGTFPRLFAPLPFEVLESPRWGYKATWTKTFTEAYALAVRLVRAYGGRNDSAVAITIDNLDTALSGKPVIGSAFTPKNNSMIADLVLHNRKGRTLYIDIQCRRFMPPPKQQHDADDAVEVRANALVGL